MLLRLVFAVAVYFAFASAYAADPECVFASSDPDGDGYGYENNQTCLITTSSVGEPPEASECIDENADGWGWNGRASCQVAITETECIDTDPKGDGWGWDGSTSCRVVAASDSFDEIEEIKQHFGVQSTLNGRFSKAAGVRCAATTYLPEIVYYFYYDGTLLTTNGDNGLWSTGLSTTDGSMMVLYFSGPYFRFYINSEFIMRGDERQVCEWL